MSVMKTYFSIALLITAALILPFSSCTRSISETIVDTHVHVDLEAGTPDLSAMVQQMDKQNFGTVFLMETPNPTLYTDGSHMSQLLAFYSSQASRFRAYYGGADLNPIVHALGRANASTLTLNDLYPNGGGTQGDVDKVKAVAADSATYTTQFQTNATNAGNSGSYVGFGEFGPYHASRRSGHPFIEYSVNHSLMKWLSDLAASKNMVIDIHVEAVGTKVSELEDLLAHNRNTKIIWQHAGWGETGGSSAELFEGVLGRNSNLYLGLKVRPSESGEMENSNMFDERGKLKPEWVRLIKTYSHRIMLGSDAKFFQGGDSASKTLLMTAPMISELLVQLPKATATAIASETAKGIFGL